MRKKLFIAACFVLLSGCKSQPVMTSGNYLTIQLDEQRQHKLVGDTLTQLSSIWPPAKTRLNLQHAAIDPFGVELVNELRKRGYAVAEFTPPQNPQNPTDTAAPLVEASDTKSYSFSYVLDHSTSNNLYRIVINVGEQSLKRAYQLKDSNLVPIGYWTRKE